jgi:hypothetical protein
MSDLAAMPDMDGTTNDIHHTSSNIEGLEMLMM